MKTDSDLDPHRLLQKPAHLGWIHTLEAKGNDRHLQPGVAWTEDGDPRYLL